MNTFIYVKNRQAHSSVQGATLYKVLVGLKPSVQHLQPFGRECWIHVPKAKRLAGNKLKPRAELAIFIGYTDVTHQYRIFLPYEKRAVFSADVIFPPPRPEAIQHPEYPLPSRPPSPQPTNRIMYQIGGKGFPNDDLWMGWMKRNPDIMIEWFRRGHPTVTRLCLNNYDKLKNEGIIPDDLGFSRANDESVQYVTTADGDPHSVHENEPPEATPSFATESRRPIASPPRSELRLPQNTTSAISQSDIDMHENAYDVPPSNDSGSHDTHVHEPQPLQTRYGRRIVRPSNWENPIPYLANPSSRHDEDTTLDLRDIELATEEVAMLSVLDITEPKMYNAAKHSDNWSEWKVAVDAEIEALKENHVWDVVLRPQNRKVIGGKWVFKAKGNAEGDVERFKARYVAQGFSQIQGLDYDKLFAPVARYDSVRLLLAISAHNKWMPRQLDIKTAFLYGVLKEEVYMELPEGHKVENCVAKLNRCIYGLKQSPREWYFRLINFLHPYGSTSSSFDPCVMIHKSGHLYIAIYVDNISLFGEQGELLDQTVALLKSEFKVNDMGNLHWLLGIQISYSQKGIELSQTAYVDKILSRFAMQDCNSVSTPLDRILQLKKINRYRYKNQSNNLPRNHRVTDLSSDCHQTGPRLHRHVAITV